MILGVLLLGARPGFSQFFSDFDSGATPPGMQLFNTAVISGGVLHLTDAANGIGGQVIIDDPFGGVPVQTFDATFKVRIGGGTARPADGMSFNFGPNLAAPSYGNPGEEGAPWNSGLVVSMDTWDNNGADEAPGISIWFNNAQVAFTSLAGQREGGRAPAGPIPTDPATGLPMEMETGADFVPVRVRLAPGGTVSVYYRGVQILTDIQTAYTPISGGKFALGARTGNANDNHWVDDLSISFGSSGPVTFVTQPVGGTFNENAIVRLSASVEGTPPYTFQWYDNGDIIPGANSPTYQFEAKPSLHNGHSFYLRVENSFGPVNSSTVTVNVNADLTAPTVANVDVPNFSQLFVKFSEPVADTAADPFLYVVTGGSVDPDTTSAVFSAPDTILVTVSPAMDAGATYNLHIEGVVDRAEAANELVPVDISFTTPGLSRGFILRQYYGVVPALGGGAPGGTQPGPIANYKNWAGYPNNPTFQCFTPRSEFNTVDQAENYGGILRGFYRADVTGDHKFYMSSDDPGALYLSTDANPANAVLIASEPQWNGRRFWVGADRRSPADINQSALIPLEAGRYYYVEAVFLEGGGGDNLAFTVQKPGAPVPANGSNPVLGADLAVIAPGINSTVNVTQHPQDRTISENTPASFSAAFTGTSTSCVGIDAVTSGTPVFVQWEKSSDNGASWVEVPGANANSYTTGPNAPDQNGALYRAVGYYPNRRQPSNPARLTVVVDATPPGVVSAASANGTQIGIRFNEILGAGAADPFKYTVNGGSPGVSSATLRPDGMGIILVLDAEVSGTFTVVGADIPDLKGNIAPSLTVTGKRWLEGVVDLGGPLPEGQHFTAAENEIEVKAGGGDIWGSSDQGTFPYKQIQGNFDVAVRVDRLDYVGNPWSKGGLNIRSSLTANSATLAWYYPTPPQGANAAEFARRATDGTDIFDVGPARPAINSFPFWVRVRRVGNQVSGYWSRDGASWNLQGAANQVANFPYNMYLTLATVSHLQGTATTAQYSQLRNINPYPDATVTVSGPDDRIVDENNDATFTVVATAVGAPQSEVWYQWYENDAPINGAAAPSYTRVVTMADTGKRFKCVVSINGNNPVSSRSALLAVIPDQNGPRMISAAGSGTFDKISVNFNEDISAGLDDSFIWSITGPGGAVLNVIAAAPNGSRGTILTLDPATRLVADTAYTVTLADGGVFDIAGNEVPLGNSIGFTSWTLSPGFAKREYYTGRGGVLITDLTSDPNYPNNPAVTDYNTFIESLTGFGDNYGVRVSGFLRPVETADYNFIMSADDGADFYLSTDADPANLYLVAREPVWNGVRDYNGTARRNAAAPENKSTSTPGLEAGVHLVAGNLYYYEARMKEAGGGDNLAVAVYKAGQPVPPNGADPVPGSFQLVVAANPAGANVNITTQPRDAVVGVGCVSGGQILVNETFDTADAGYTVVTETVFNTPWTYRSASGSWGVDGQGPELGARMSSRLNSPNYTFTRGGLAQLTIRHRWSVEGGPAPGDLWDGCQLRISVNDGPYQMVPAASFTENPYNGTVRSGSASEITGQPAFVWDSPGGAGRPFLNSVVSLGNVNPGDRVKVQLLFAGDTNTRGTYLPSWELTQLQIVQGIAVDTAAPTFASDFEGGLPAGMSVYNGARVDAGILKITDAINSQNSSVVIEDFTGGQQVRAFTARFKVRIGDSTCCGGPRPADGFSFNFANNLPNGPFSPAIPCCGAEDGGGSGLTVSFDTWDNNGDDTAPAIDLIYAGQIKATVSTAGPREGGRPTVTPVPTDDNGVPINIYTGNDWVDVVVRLDTDGTVDVSWKGVLVINNVQSGYTPTTGRFGFGARTGGANETHWVDDLNITLGGGAATPISFSVAATGSYPGNANGPLFYQWQRNSGSGWQNVPGANGNRNPLNTSVTAVDAGTMYRCQVSTIGATTTSAAAAVVYDRAPRVLITSPTDGSKATAGQDVVIAADATDPDGTIARVEFFVAGVGSLGVDNNPAGGWSVTVPGAIVAPGVYLITALATDNLGVQCESGPAMVEVVPNACPSFALANASVSSPEDSGPQSTAQAVSISAGAAHESGQIVSFQVSNSNPALFSAQPSISSSGVLSYTAAPNACGCVMVSVVAKDNGGTAAGGCDTSAAQTFELCITPVNDPPACADTSATTAEDTAVNIPLPGMDLDMGCAPEVLNGALVSGPAHGSVSISGLVARYTPAADYCGADAFTFRVVDAAGAASGVCTVTINVTAVNDPPVAVINVSPLDDLGASTPGLNVISGNNVGACVTLDGSQSSDVDANGCGDAGPLTYEWYVDGVSIGSGAVQTDVCLPVGAREVTLVVSDGTAEGTTTSVVNVLSGAEVAEALILEVYASTIDRKNKQQFIATLKNAGAAFERGSTGAGLNMMEAFINKVEAQLKDNPDVQAEWIRLAHEVIDGISRPVTCEGCTE